MIEKKIHITGMGAALVDISAQVSDSELEALGSKKSTMMLIDETTSKNLLKNIKPETITAGGSVANSIAGIAEMGLKNCIYRQTFK